MKRDSRTRAPFYFHRDNTPDLEATVLGQVVDGLVEDFEFVSVVVDPSGEPFPVDELTDEEISRAEEAIREQANDDGEAAYSAHCDHLVDCARDARFDE